MIDGVHIDDHCMVVALGIGADVPRPRRARWEAPPRTPSW